MANNRNFFAGLVVGSLLGFAAGVLFAPAPGRETREIIANKTQTVVRETRGSVEEVSGVVKGNVTKAVDLVKNRCPGKFVGTDGLNDKENGEGAELA